MLEQPWSGCQRSTVLHSPGHVIAQKYQLKLHCVRRLDRASEELVRLHKVISILISMLTSLFTKGTSIPSRARHFGGLWESAVYKDSTVTVYSTNTQPYTLPLYIRVFNEVGKLFGCCILYAVILL